LLNRHADRYGENRKIGVDSAAGEDFVGESLMTAASIQRSMRGGFEMLDVMGILVEFPLP